MFLIVVILRYALARRLTVVTVRMDTIQQHGEIKDASHFLKPYNKVRHQFDSEYDRANPVTSQERIKQYLKWILSKLIL